MNGSVKNISLKFSSVGAAGTNVGGIWIISLEFLNAESTIHNKGKSVNRLPTNKNIWMIMLDMFRLMLLEAFLKRE